VTREEALNKAAEHVNKLSPDTRNMTGPTLPQKVDAVERLARFLMGDVTDDLQGE